jgi:hypothetical protein
MYYCQTKQTAKILYSRHTLFDCMREVFTAMKIRGPFCPYLQGEDGGSLLLLLLLVLVFLLFTSVYC